MDNNYKITLTSKIAGEEKQSVNLGCVYEEYGQTIISYFNYEGDFSYQTKIAIGSDIISIINTGSVESTINLEMGIKHNSKIVTEFGEILISTNLNSFKFEKKCGSVYLLIDYQIMYADYPEDLLIELNANIIDK